jgi:hemerythrin
MSLIAWNKQLELGVAEVDTQHKRLVEMVNRLHDAMAQGHGADIMGRLLDDLIAYTVSHFATEERLMKAGGYPGAPAHLREHDNLKKAVSELQREFKAGKKMLTLEVMKFLRDWLTHHILESDRALATWLASHPAHAAH